MSTVQTLRGRLKRIFPWYPAFKEWYRHQTGGDWSPYYESDYLTSEPEVCLLKLPIPAYIDTILDLGCGSGRNLIPFEGKRLWAIELVPKERIHWVKDFKNLDYEQLTVEQLTRRLEKHPVDMSKTLVFSSGTMMMVSRRYQKRFYDVCLKCGCRNFIFQDYEPGSIKHPYYHLKLPLTDFNVASFRDHLGPYQTRTFYRLESSSNVSTK